MTTLDLFFGVTTVAIIVLTFFACWTMYYIVGLLRRMHGFLDECERGINSLGRSFEEVARRAEVFKSTIEFLMQTGKSLMGVYQKRTGKRTKKKEEE